MDFRQLVYFVSVVEAQSFSHAAEILFISQPSLSKSISKLEDEFNIKLIHRTSHTFKVTDNGRLFYEKSKRIVSEYELLNKYMQSISAATSGKILCGVPPVLNTILAPYVLLNFKEYYPGIEVVFNEMPTKDMCNELLKKNLDMALGILPADTTVFDTFDISSDRVSLVMPSDHPLAAKDEIEASDLQDEPLILLNKKYQLYDNIFQACMELGFTPDVKSTSLNWDFLISAVKLRLGLAILPRPILTNLDYGLVQRPFKDNLGQWSIVALTNKDSTPSALAKTLISFLQSEVRF